MSDYEYKVKRPDREYPVPDVAHLRDWARRGNVGPQDVIFVEKLKSYYRATQLKELQDIFATQTPAEPQQYRSIHAPFYINQSGKQSPVDRLEDLQEMAASGRLSPDDSVYHPSFGRWRRAGDVAQLSAYFAPRSGAHSIALPQAQNASPRSSIDQINAVMHNSPGSDRPKTAYPQRPSSQFGAPARAPESDRPIDAPMNDGAVEGADSTARTMMDFQAADVVRAMRQIQDRTALGQSDERPHASIDQLNDLMLDKMRNGGVAMTPIRISAGPDLAVKTPPPNMGGGAKALSAGPRSGAPAQPAPNLAAGIRKGLPVRRPTAEFLQAGLVKPPAGSFVNHANSNAPAALKSPAKPGASLSGINPNLPRLSAKTTPREVRPEPEDNMETRLDMNAMPLLMGEMARGRAPEAVSERPSGSVAVADAFHQRRPPLPERKSVAMPVVPASKPVSVPPPSSVNMPFVDDNEPLDEDAHFVDKTGVFRLFYDVARTFMVTKELRPGESLESECKLLSTGDSFSGSNKRAIYRIIAQRIDEHLSGPLAAVTVTPDNKAGYRLLIHRTRELLDIIRGADEFIGLMPPERVVIGNVGRPKMHPDEEKAMLRIDSALRGLIAVRAR